MSKYKYSKTEQQINDVLKYHDERLKEINASMPSTSELDNRIQESEDMLRMLGYTDMPTVPKRDEPKKLMVVPSWDDLCTEAKNAVGSGHSLESIFTNDELQRNSQEIKLLNAEYNQLHHLDKYDIAISAAAGLLGAAVDILLVGIPQKTPEGLKGAPLSNYIRDWWDTLHDENPYGSEGGIILLDEEYHQSCRITLEKCERYYAITCGIYGSMVHTVFSDQEHYQVT